MGSIVTGWTPSRNGNLPASVPVISCRGRRRLLHPVRGHRHPQLVGEDLSGVLVLQARDDHPGDAEGRRDDAAGVTGVDPFGGDLDVELAGQQAAQ